MSVATFAKETEETAELNAALRKQAPENIEKSEPKRAPFTDHETFTWERVSYTVPFLERSAPPQGPLRGLIRR
jgi:hypothetical protein